MALGPGRCERKWQRLPRALPVCIQYQESDLAFVQRLLIEEGLFCWIEHQGNATDASLGAHTLVIADHNGAFKPGAQPRVRFTQALIASDSAPDLNPLAALLPEDSLSRWRCTAAVHTASLDLASPDYRALSLRAQSQCADPRISAVPLPELSLADIPGAYAYEDAAQGERLALRQMQALDAQREQAQAQGSVRSAAPGTTFTLLDHAEHDGSDEARDRFVTLSVAHRARNNLRADHQAQVPSLLGSIHAINQKSSAGHTTHHAQGEGACCSNRHSKGDRQKVPLVSWGRARRRRAVPSAARRTIGAHLRSPHDCPHRNPSRRRCL